MRKFIFNGVEISDTSVFMLTGTGNTDGGTVSRKEISYVDTDGYEITDILFNARTIEIYGFLTASTKEEFEALKQKLIVACNPKKKTLLQYFAHSVSYSANCYPAQLPSFNKINNKSAEFTVYIDLYEFYWLSLENLLNPVFEQRDMISSSFTLPAVFSQRINEAEIINDGCAPAYPVFEIYRVGEFLEENILIRNDTTGQCITLNYIPELDEKITIDCYLRKITSSVNGNIIDKITSDSDFIRYDEGVNKITANGVGISVLSTHKNKYLGV